MSDIKNWMEEKDGYQLIPHKNGKIKWYVLGFEQDGGHYVGEYDMTDWDKTFNEVVFPEAEKIAHDWLFSNEWQVMRKDQLIDMMFSVAGALYSSGDFKEEWVVGTDWYDWLDEVNDGV
jgi:hypothetical protein